MWFGSRKPTLEMQVDAFIQVQFNLYEQTTLGLYGAPSPLQFSLPDSRFRYFLFCLSTVQMACAGRMSDPDAVMNEVLRRIVMGDKDLFFDGPMPYPEPGIEAARQLGFHLATWSHYLEARPLDEVGAKGFVVLAIHTTETHAALRDQDTMSMFTRLFPLVNWIVERLDVMANAFANMAKKGVPR